MRKFRDRAPQRNQHLQLRILDPNVKSPAPPPLELPRGTTTSSRPINRERRAQTVYCNIVIIVVPRKSAQILICDVPSDIISVLSSYNTVLK